MRIERSGGHGLDGLATIKNQFVQPAMGVAKGFGDDRTCLNSHWADSWVRVTDPASDLRPLCKARET